MHLPGVEIRSKTLGKGSGEKAVPAITVSLSIDIPVEESLSSKKPPLPHCEFLSKNADIPPLNPSTQT